MPQLDRKIRYYHANSASSDTWAMREELWSDMVKRLTAVRRGAETMDEYKKKSTTDKSALKNVGGFVGGVLKDGKRSNANVVVRSLINLDADDIKDDFWFSFDSLFGNAAVMYQTRSWTPEKPKYRLVIPLSEDVSPLLWQAISYDIAHKLGRHNFDKVSFVPAQLMYWPSLCADAEHHVEVSEGELFDVQAWVAEHPYWEDHTSWPGAEDDAIAEVKLTNEKLGDPREKSGLIGAFCRAHSIRDALWNFLSDKYTEEDDGRFTYVHATGKSGLVIYGDTLCYSHHSSDPLSEPVEGRQRAYNAWDLVRVHKFGRGKDSEAQMRLLASEDKLVMENIAAEAQGAFDEYNETGAPQPRKMFFRIDPARGSAVFTPKKVVDWYSSLSPLAKIGGDLYRYKDGKYVEAKEQFEYDVTKALDEESTVSRVKEAFGNAVATARTIKDPFGGGYRLNVKNGLLNVLTGELEPHDPEFLSTVQLPWDYDPNAVCPTIDRFFNEYAGKHAELVWYMIGYCLLPTMRFEKSFMLLGDGGNGKGTTLSLISAMLGDENVSNVSLHSLEGNRFASAGLIGKLANIQNDLPGKPIDNEGVMKQITSGDRLTVERKNKDSFSVRLRAKMMFSANELPHTYDTSYGFFRKWCVFTYEKTFNDRAMREQIFKEIPGMLTKAVKYAAKLNNMEAFPGDGDVEKYVLKSDSVYAFIASHIVKEESSVITKKEVFQAYCDFCAAEGIKSSWNRNRFGGKFHAHTGAVESKTGKSGHIWKGVRLCDIGDLTVM